MTPARVLLVILGAIVATFVIKRVVKRMLERLFERTAAPDRPRVDARRRALSSATRAAVVGVIWTVAVITVLGEVGINLGAFIATATVVGGAIAFGAQTMIRDVISGFFVLSDDQFGVGDDVDLGAASGVVERVTLRSARLRDGEGRVWHVPHGMVSHVANLSKQQTVHLDLDVARTMTAGEALRISQQLGDSLVVDPAVAGLLKSHPIVAGINGLGDDRFVTRVSVDIVPGNGDKVRRAWRVLALDAFADGRLTAPPLLFPPLPLSPPADSAS